MMQIRPANAEPLASTSLANVDRFLCSVGNDLFNRVVVAVQSVPACKSEDAGVTRVLSAFLGKPRTLRGRVAEAAWLDMDRRTLKRKVIVTASAAYVSSRMHAASIFSRLLLFLAQRKIEVISVVSTMSWDETPLPMKASSLESQKRLCVDRLDFTLPADVAGWLSQNELLDKRDRGTMKIVQCHVQVTVTFLDIASQAARCWVIELPCPLSIVDRATGAALQSVLQEQTTLPLLPQIRAAAAVTHDLCVRDSAPANAVADELGYGRAGGALRLCVGCCAHGVSNAQGYAFWAVKDCISGIISLSLSQKTGGAVPLLRAAVAEILFRRVRIRKARKVIESNDAQMSYRNAVFDMCIKKDPAGIARRANLEQLLNGDLQREDIDLWVHNDAGIDLRAWARHVAELLLPRTVSVFPRLCRSQN